MGKEADVEARWPDGRIAVGRLQYEPPKLVFRGPPRVSFAAEALSGVRADGRELILAGGERFRLPTAAQSWVDAILRPKLGTDRVVLDGSGEAVISQAAGPRIRQRELVATPARTASTPELSFQIRPTAHGGLS
jgi:hypothetical protein